MLVTATFTRYTVGLQYTVGEYSKPSQLIATYRIVRNDGAYLDWDGMLATIWSENVLPKPTVAPYTSFPSRAFTSAPAHIGHGSSVTAIEQPSSRHSPSFRPATRIATISA